MATTNLTRDKARRPIYKCRRCGAMTDGLQIDLDEYNELMRCNLQHRMIGIHDCYVKTDNDDDYTSGITDLIGFDRQLKVKSDTE